MEPPHLVRIALEVFAKAAGRGRTRGPRMRTIQVRMQRGAHKGRHPTRALPHHGLTSSQASLRMMAVRPMCPIVTVHWNSIGNQTSTRTLSGSTTISRTQKLCLMTLQLQDLHTIAQVTHILRGRHLQNTPSNGAIIARTQRRENAQPRGSAVCARG